MKKEEMNFEKTAVKVSYVSIVGNIVLTVFKMAVGIFANSAAMVSDAVHSASDIISSVVVIIGVKISAKESDESHPYGHERFECVAAIILSAILCATGILIGVNSLKTILSGNFSAVAVPGKLALVAAVVSIISKEAMYQYTKKYAVMFNSGALMADAWHHRSDALSSVGALIGIAGAILAFPILDSIASGIIAVFIIKAAYDIFMDAVEKMVDRACDVQTENSMRNVILSCDGVLGLSVLNTRQFASKVYVEIEIEADGNLSLYQSHQIAQNVHDLIEKQFPMVKHCIVHVNPYKN